MAILINYSIQVYSVLNKVLKGGVHRNMTINMLLMSRTVTGRSCVLRTEHALLAKAASSCSVLIAKGIRLLRY